MNERVTPGWAITVVGVTIWAFVVLGAYYVVHKPLETGQLPAVFGVALTLIVPAALWWIAAGVGAGLLSWVDPQDSSPENPAEPASWPAERAALSIGLGLGAMGILVLALALAGALRRSLFIGLLLLGLILTARPALRMLRAVWSRGLLLPAGRLPRLMAAVAGISLFLTLLQALMPPTAWDGLAYHLTGPKLYIQSGRILPGLDIPHLAFPELTEMLFTAGLLLAGPASAQVLHWGFAILTVTLVLAIARRHLDLRIGWLAAALLYSVPSLVLVSYWPYVDVALAFWETAAVYAVLRWLEGSRRWLVLAGVFAGLGMSTKYTAVTLVPAILLFVVWQARRHGVRRVLADGLMFCLPATLMTLPWLIKNWVYVGNPVYPFLFSQGANWDAFRAALFARPGTGLAFTAPLRLLFAPWEMTVLGVEGKQGFAASIGPVLLIGLPLAWLVRSEANAPERRVLNALLTVSGAQYLIWLVGVAWSASLMQTRLLLPAFPLLALIAAFGLSRATALRRSVFAADWVLNAVVVLALSLSLLGFAAEAARTVSLPYLAGWESADQYLPVRLGRYYDAMRRINELPANARVYFLWEPRSFYCDRPARPDALLDAFPHLIHRFGSAEAIADYLRRESFTHVLLYRQGMEFVRQAKEDPIAEADWTLLEDLIRNQSRAVYDDGGWYELYELKSS